MAVRVILFDKDVRVFPEATGWYHRGDFTIIIRQEPDDEEPEQLAEIATRQVLVIEHDDD